CTLEPVACARSNSVLARRKPWNALGKDAPLALLVSTSPACEPGSNFDICSLRPQPPHFSSQAFCNLGCNFGLRNTRCASLAAREFRFAAIVGEGVPSKVALSPN
ncbi:MAG: hypothetical protein WBQ53_03575, partial [Methylocystis sp.]